MIVDTINSDLKEAMKARDTLRLEVLRSIKTAFTNELVATGHTPQETIDEESAMKVIKRLAKQRTEASEAFRAGGREDLASKEDSELEIIKTYLPEEMNESEIRTIAEKKKDELNIDDKSKIGILIGAVMKETNGRADGKLVKQVVESLFS
jgi:uncharacterized protein YqeY